VRNPLFIVTQNLILRSCVQRRKGINSTQYVLKLFSHDAPMVSLRKPLQTFLESALNRFSERFSRLPGDLPSQAFGKGVLDAQGHLVLSFYHSILVYRIIYGKP